MKTASLTIILLLLLVRSIFTLQYGFGLIDEGESLHNAQRILKGDLPYRNFFAVFPPLDNYYYAGIMKLFGTSIIAPRIISTLIFSLAVLGMYLLAGPVSAVLLIFADISPDRLFFFAPIFWAIYLFVHKKSYFFAGLLLGLISWFRIDIPATFFISLVLLGILTKRKPLFLGILTLGYTLPILGLFIWLVHFNIVELFIHQGVTQALLVTKLMELPVLSPLKMLVSPLSLKSAYNIFTSLYFYLLISSLFAGLFWCIKNRNLVAAIFLISGLMTLPYITGRTDIGHMVKGGMYLFVLLGIWTNSSTLWLKQLSRLISVLLVMAGIAQTAWMVKFNDTALKINGYVLRVNSSYVPGTTLPSARTLKSAVEFLQTSPQNQPVLAVPYMAGLYYLADRPSSTKYNNILGGEVATVKDQTDFINQVEKNAVTTVVYDPKDNYPDSGLELKTYNPLIHQYIINTYQVVSTSPEGWLFMKRKI